MANQLLYRFSPIPDPLPAEILLQNDLAAPGVLFPRRDGGVGRKIAILSGLHGPLVMVLGVGFLAPLVTAAVRGPVVDHIDGLGGVHMAVPAAGSGVFHLNWIDLAGFKGADAPALVVLRRPELRQALHGGIGMARRSLKGKLSLHTAMLPGYIISFRPGDSDVELHLSGQRMTGRALLRFGAGNRPGVVDLGNRTLQAVQLGAVGGQVLSIDVQCSRIFLLLFYGFKTANKAHDADSD